MATLTGLIPVTVGTFAAYHGGGVGGGGGIPLGGGGGLGTQSAGPYISTRRVTCFDLFGRFVCVDGKIGLLDFFANSRGQQGR